MVDAYRLVGYSDGLLGASSPGCDILLPHMDSGLTWGDENNPQPGDWRWDGGVAGGITWDGTFYRDLARYPAGGQFLWAAYLKPGTGPGSGNGFWLNFGSGWCHLANDNPAQMLTGACPRLFWDSTASVWKLVIEATMFVTGAVVDVWTGIKQGGNDPVGTYTRVSGCDPLASLMIEAGQ